MSTFKQVGAAWIKNQEDGGSFISVGLKRTNGELVNFNLFLNKNKKAPNQPDYTASMEEGLADALGLGEQAKSPDSSSSRVKDTGQQYKGNAISEQPAPVVQESTTQPKQKPF